MKSQHWAQLKKTSSTTGALSPRPTLRLPRQKQLKNNSQVWKTSWITIYLLIKKSLYWRFRIVHGAEPPIRFYISEAEGAGGSINVVFVHIISAPIEKSCEFLWYCQARFAEWKIKGTSRDAWRVLLRFNAGNDTLRREKNGASSAEAMCVLHLRHFGFCSSSAGGGSERCKNIYICSSWCYVQVVINRG